MFADSPIRAARLGQSGGEVVILVFDPAAFDDLTASDPKLQRELLSIFRAQLPELMSEAASEARAEFVHKLTGLAANLAAPQLQSVAKVWVNDPDVHRLEAALRDLESSMEAHLATRVN